MARAAMAASPAVQRETVGLVVVAVRSRLRLRLSLRLLSASDERRQPVDVSFRRRAGVMLLLPRLIRLVLRLLRERLCVARDIGLRFARAVGRIAGTAERGLSVVVAVIEIVVARA